jgi:serine/threonine-protein kinase
MNIPLVWVQANFGELTNILQFPSGGAKLVFAATHPTDGDVVLKIIRPSHGIDEISREILAVQQMVGVRVPSILASGSIPTPFGTCFWFRERRILGSTLRQLLAQGPLRAGEVLVLARDIVEVLEAAEAVLIVHRDVKPENIIRDTAGRYWLLDFGIARHLTLGSLTATALPLGKMTPGYAPPEQARNLKRAIDSRADLFALGVTLHEAATGVNVFIQGARDFQDILQRVESLALRPLKLQLQMSASFDDLVACMTQKRRDHRPRSVTEARAWLQDICSAEGL